MLPLLPDSLDELVDHVIPVLQRGELSIAATPPATLLEHLGLKTARRRRPAGWGSLRTNRLLDEFRRGVRRIRSLLDFRKEDLAGLEDVEGVEDLLDPALELASPRQGDHGTGSRRTRSLSCHGPAWAGWT